MKILLKLVLLLVASTNAFATLNYQRGKVNGGFLGEPSRNSLSAKKLPPAQWFQQNLDHFDPTNQAVWKQRYFVTDSYYKPGGPIFLMIGGEGEAMAKWNVQGAWIKYAKKFNALCIQLEHRFYGKSHPTSDLSIKNLVYLSSEQALADIAFFIESMNEKMNLTEDVKTKWIAFGGSYPGSLAAWVREKYPHLVHGSISSSGPLLAKVDFYEYYDVVKNSLATYSQNCVDSVIKGMEQIEILLKHKIGQQTLNSNFKLCDPIEKSIENPLDITNLFSNLASNFAGVVQYNKDNSPHATVTIDEICDIMINTTIGPQVTRLAEVNTLLMKESKTKCFDYKYENMINMMKNISWDSEMANGGRQWIYQTCTEFGFYQTSTKPNELFGARFPVDFSVKQCEDIYSTSFNMNSLNNLVKRTNIYYGALHPHTTNVLYVHGSIDPWHALGLISSNNPQTPTIYIQGTAHCANMYEPRDEDPPQLVEARNQIEKYIAKLLVDI